MPRGKYYSNRHVLYDLKRFMWYVVTPCSFQTVHAILATKQHHTRSASFVSYLPRIGSTMQNIYCKTCTLASNCHAWLIMIGIFCTLPCRFINWQIMKLLLLKRVYHLHCSFAHVPCLDTWNRKLWYIYHDACTIYDNGTFIKCLAYNFI